MKHPYNLGVRIHVVPLDDWFLLPKRYLPDYDVRISSRVWCTDGKLSRRRHSWSLGYVRMYKRQFKMMWDSEHHRNGVAYPRERDLMMPISGIESWSARRAMNALAHKAMTLILPREASYHDQTGLGQIILESIQTQVVLLDVLAT